MQNTSPQNRLGSPLHHSQVFLLEGEHGLSDTFLRLSNTHSTTIIIRGSMHGLIFVFADEAGLVRVCISRPLGLLVAYPVLSTVPQPVVTRMLRADTRVPGYAYPPGTRMCLLYASMHGRTNNTSTCFAHCSVCGDGGLHMHMLTAAAIHNSSLFRVSLRHATRVLVGKCGYAQFACAVSLS